MADHRAEQILAQVEVILRGLVTTEQNVFRDRDTPIELSDMPALLIDYGSKNPVSELGADNMAFVDAYLDVVITAKVANNEDAGKILNEISKEVYVAMRADYRLGLSGFVMNSIWRGDSTRDISSDGNVDIAVMEMEWAIKYRHSIGDPSQ